MNCLNPNLDPNLDPEPDPDPNPNPDPNPDPDPLPWALQTSSLTKLPLRNLDGTQPFFTKYDQVSKMTLTI